MSDTPRQRGRPPSAARNSAGQRLGHTAAEIRRLEMRLQLMQAEFAKQNAELRARDVLLARANERVADALIQLTDYTAKQEEHRNDQVDTAITQIRDTVLEIRKEQHHELERQRARRLLARHPKAFRRLI